MNSIPGADFILAGIFIVAVATTVIGALIAVLTTRVIRSVCGLAICCLGLSGLYYFLHSPFLALMEILIYIGAVCVTIVFAIMLSEPDEPKPKGRSSSAVAWGGFALAVSGLVFWGLCRLSVQAPIATPATRLTDGSIKAIGISLLTTYSLAFELISLALLVAILGALAIARTGREKAPLASSRLGSCVGDNAADRSSAERRMQNAESISPLRTPDSALTSAAFSRTQPQLVGAPISTQASPHE